MYQIFKKKENNAKSPPNSLLYLLFMYSFLVAHNKEADFYVNTKRQRYFTPKGQSKYFFYFECLWLGSPGPESDSRRMDYKASWVFNRVYQLILAILMWLKTPLKVSDRQQQTILSCSCIWDLAGLSWGLITSWHIEGEKVEEVTDCLTLALKSLWRVTAAMKLEEDCFLAGKHFLDCF